MAVIVVASVSGAAGATTVAAGLAAGWPAGAALLVEADPHGGQLAARFGLRFSPGLATAAAAARHGDGLDLPGHTQRSPIGVDTVVAPACADVAAAALAGLSQVDIASTGVPVVADVGRLAPPHAAGWLVRGADALLLVAWPRLDCLSVASYQLQALPDAVRERTRLVLRAGAGYTRGEVERELGVEVVAVLPRDLTGAAVLAGRATVGRMWRRLPLPRAASRLAATLATDAPAQTVATVNGGAS